MQRISLSHLSNGQLKAALHAVVRQANQVIAVVLAHIAEFAARKLYREAGYSSMTAYCIGELHLSEQAAFKRMCAAGAARKYPMVLDAVADGRLHLSAVVVLKPHFTPENVNELIAAATHKTREQIERLIAIRFPKADVPTAIRPVTSPSPLAAASVMELSQNPSPGKDFHQPPASLPDSEAPLSPARVEPTAMWGRVAPLSVDSYEFRFTASSAAHDKLRRAQDLLGVAHSNVAPVVEQALDALIAQLEKRKLGAGSPPRTARQAPSSDSRYIPKHMRRAVWQRDGGRCTFAGDGGHRCSETRDLEFDHVHPLAQGGETSIENLRLLCRAHNQFEAERALGAGFMRRKRG